MLNLGKKSVGRAFGWLLGLSVLVVFCAPAMAETTKEIVQQPKKSTSKISDKAIAKTSPKNQSINKNEVQELYHAGEFDQLIALLENMRHQKGMRDREDSIFIYKYLGVVYGADMTTRRKAESFLYQMLKLDPRQDLVELEVGDAILNIFQEVRKRYDRTAADSDSTEERNRVRQNLKTFGYPIDSTGHNLINVTIDSSSNAAPSGTSHSTSASSQSAAVHSTDNNDRTWIWVAGGAAAVTLAGVATILLMSDPDTKTTTIETTLK